MEKDRIFKLLLLLIAGVCMSVDAFAQQIAVKGLVKDATGEPVIGANVVVKGTTNGTVTDYDGNFQLTADKNSLITISYIGYKSQEVPAAPMLNILLEDNSQLLEDIVVIGYGTVKKNDATGSVTAIKPDKISKGITTSAQDMMTGKIAGVNIVSDGGKPGAGATIRVRGGSSLNASNDPLIVIDGLAMDNDGIKGLSNGLALVNPNDIETFTVLKDASATAIYGSRASNGVIIITTKKGAAGSAPKVSYDGNVSFGIARNKVDLMDGDQYRAYVASVYGADNIPGELGTANTDWQDQIYRTAVSHDHNITLSGGLKNMPYRASVSYTDQNGIIKTSNFNRFTASVNVAPAFFDNYLKLNVNAKAMVAHNRFAEGGVVGSALRMDPTRPIRDNSSAFATTGGYWQYMQSASLSDPAWNSIPMTQSTQNPVAQLDLRDDTSKSKSFIGNIEVDYKFHFFPDLRLHANFGGDYSNGRQTTLVSPYSWSNNYYGWDGIAKEDKYNLAGSAYLQYFKEVKNHAVDVMAGLEEQHFHRTGYNYGQGTDPYTGEAKDAQVRESTAYGSHSTLVSYFGRVNYTWMNKYMFTATVRWDGSSRFASNNRWGTFPSGAVGWKIKEENFLKDVDFLSDLKLRAGWGITGQQNIGSDFAYIPVYTISGSYAYYPFGNEYYTTSRPKEYNKDLKWEKTTTYNAGLDFGFLNGRINGSVDYYFRKTDDLINTVQIAQGTNFNSQLISNVGSLENEGIEFTINTKPVVTHDFVWDLGFNVTYNRNEITELTGGNNENYYVNAGNTVSRGTGSYVQAHKVGYASSSFYVYQQVYDQDGKPIENMFVDRNGDGIINSDDRYMYKKPTADVLMGLTSKMTYKNWDFSFGLRASLNNYIYNDVLANNADVKNLYTNSNYSNRPLADIRLGFEGKGDYYMSDYFVQNASFLRCDNITLGYSFDKLFRTQGYGGVNGRIYTTVQNPFVITSYDGLDPEVSYTDSNGKVALGIDKDAYPRPVSFLVGLSLQF